MLDPNNFEILAMANYPAYDLNDVPRDETELLNSLSRNRIVCDIYEPGSTFKVITAAADIEENLRGNRNAFSTSYIFPRSRSRFPVDGTTVKCWSNHANGKHCNQTLSDAINNSCNPWLYGHRALAREGYLLRLSFRVRIRKDDGRGL